jgi:hypothetical protein
MIIPLICASLLLAFSTGTIGQQAAPARPAAPLAVVQGEAVQLAWGLPAGLKPSQVLLFRAAKDDSQFERIAELEGSALRFTDTEVKLGRTYLYQLQLVRGAERSAVSPVTEIRVGGSARVQFLGGSTERALFEVVMYRRGKRISAQFVHKPGDVIGDLQYVPELETIEDFRLGPKLVKLDLSRAVASTRSRETLRDKAGTDLVDSAGNPVKLEFEFPGAEQEIAQATITDNENRPRVMREGQTLRME